MVNQKSTEKNSWLLAVEIKSNAKTFEMLQYLQPIFGEPVFDSELCEILQAGSVNIKKCLNISTDYEVKISRLETFLCPRCRRYAVSYEDDICNRCNKILAQQKANTLNSYK